MFDDFCLSVEWVEPRLRLTPHLWDLQNSTATDLVPGKVVYFVLFCVFIVYIFCVFPLFFCETNLAWYKEEAIHLTSMTLYESKEV